jgi:hypothetical protein
MRFLFSVVMLMAAIAAIVKVHDDVAPLPDLPPVPCPGCGALIYPPVEGVRPCHPAQTKE